MAGVALPDSYQPDGVSQVSVLLGNEKPLREKPLFWKADAPWPPQPERPDRIYRVYATEHMRDWPSTPAREVADDGNTATVEVPIDGRKRYFLRVEVQVIQP